MSVLAGCCSRRAADPLRPRRRSGRDARGRRQRLPRRRRRAPLDRGHHRHPGALPRHRGRAARHRDGLRVPARAGPTSPRCVSPTAPVPGDPGPVRALLRRVRVAAALHGGRPPVYETGSTPRPRCSAAWTSADKLGLFVVTGAVAALAGVYYRCATTAPAATWRPGWSCQMVAAVLLGGVSIFGGRGGLLGVVAAVRSSASSAARCSPAEPSGQPHQHRDRRLLCARSMPPDFSPGARRLRSPARERRHHDDPHRTGKEQHEVLAFPADRLAAVGVAAALALSACSGTSAATTTPSDGGYGGGDVRLPAEEPRQPLLRRLRQGRQGASRSSAASTGGRPGGGQPRRAGAVHHHRRDPEGGGAHRLAPTTRPCLRPAERGRDAGIKVVTFDADTNPDCRDLYVNSRPPRGSQGADRLVAEQIGDGGEVAILSAAANAANQNAWIEMMED